jgi:S-DNA-T family DNA segregation ATPase FtsK/SpoIIIE
VHGAFVDDNEVIVVVAHLKRQGKPHYLEEITKEEDDDSASFDAMNGTGSGDDLYDQAVAIVIRDKKASTSYIQRQLRIGYNRAADIIDKMEAEGVVSAPNHVGKREILVLND